MNKFLIVRLSSLGDIIHTIPLAAALREAFPNSRIDWLVERRYAEVLDGASPLHAIWPVELSSPRTVLKLTWTMRSLRRMKYDVAIDVQGLMKSAVLAGASGAHHVVGFGRGAARESAASGFYTRSCSPPEGIHRIQKNLALLQTLGLRTTTIQFPFTYHERTSALNFPDVLQVGRPFVLMIPTATWANKLWPPERFGLLAKRIRDKYALPSIVDRGSGDGPIAAAVAGASDGSAMVAPRMSISDLWSAVRAATLVVSLDTGPLHMAAAVGTPVVGIYGPTDPRQTGPWSPEDETVSRYSKCHCPYRRWCHVMTQCIEQIGVDEVFQAVERRMERIRSLASMLEG